MSARIWQEKRKLKTYKVGEGNEAPHFIEKKQYQGACGKVYPLQMADCIFDETEDKEYDMVRLENDYISVDLLPAIGGKIYGASSKKDGYEFIYENPVVKPALIGLCGPWVSGGVEFNWPQHHRPTTYAPVEYKMQENADGSVTCFMGELEPFRHMRGMVAVTISPDSTLVEAKATVTNCTDRPLPFMWWNNTAVRVHSRYKAIFPPDIEYGSDHDRRAIIPFPVMKGIFKTARPYDYGEGTDVTWFSNVKVPTSVMIPRGETKMDFLGGYDYKCGAGTVIIHDHHESPGCKMFTWGDAEFGKKWCANLTDNDDRYMELMAGSYTDNQPDFAYIEPGETKEFVSYWYPIRGIGNVSNACTDAAVVLEPVGEAGKWNVGAVVTGAHSNLKLVLSADGRTLTEGQTLTEKQAGADGQSGAEGQTITEKQSGVNGQILMDGQSGAGGRTLTDGQTLYERSGALDPEGFWLEEVSVPEGIREEQLTLALYDGEGRKILSYTPTVKGLKQPPKPRERAPYPKDVDSVEMLYLYGRHLAQYKHGTYQPEDYYMEALRRSPEDYRCNLEMGKIVLERGDFDRAEHYLRAAVKRITFENTSPEDAESYYQMGRLLRLKGEKEEAYDYFRAAAWQYPYRSCAYFECTCISSALGNRERAIVELKKALETNTRFYAAQTLLAYLTGDRASIEELLAEFPLDGSARYARWLMGGGPVEEFVRESPEPVLDAALLFEKAGLRDEAVRILRDCTRPSMNLLFHLQALTGEAAGEASLSLWLPNRLEDIAVLESIGTRGSVPEEKGSVPAEAGIGQEDCGASGSVPAGSGSVPMEAGIGQKESRAPETASAGKGSVPTETGAGQKEGSASETASARKGNAPIEIGIEQKESGAVETASAGKGNTSIEAGAGQEEDGAPCGDWRAMYLLGCLYYDRENYAAAGECWEKSISKNNRYGYTWRNLAIACYDHLGKPQNALPYMRRAVELTPQNPRLVYELMQIEKADRLPLAERIKTTEIYRDQTYERDDAWLDAAILRILNGEYAKAKEMLLGKSFHIYEGGEGKLTKYHRWLHVLTAGEAMKAGDYAAAGKELDDALIYPLSYGEGRGYLEQDANVHYFAGRLCELAGRPEEAEAYYRKAEEEPELINEILFFTGLCEEKLGHKEAALRHFHMLLEEGETYAQNPDRYGYFGVGMESPLPFESDIHKNNMVKAHILKMLAYRGLREMAACDGEKAALKKIDPDNPLLIIMEKLGVV